MCGDQDEEPISVSAGRYRPESKPLGSDVLSSVVQDKRHTMKSFTAYADWVKSVHFSDPKPASRVSQRAELLTRTLGLPVPSSGH